MRRCVLTLALATACSAIAMGIPAAAQAPTIAKPRPAPPGTPPMVALPPAQIDNTLDIGGDDVNARQVESRLTVEVHVNGRGPYHFVVDSGADTSVVGLRIARDLQLPLGRPAILNNMTSRNIVDRVKVSELKLGPSTIRDLEVPALREQDLGGEGMIGIDALVRQRLMMDFEKRLIKIEDSHKPIRVLPGEIVITARRQRGQLILTEVKAGRFALDAVIDTGSQITVGNMKLRDKLVRRGRDKFFTVAMTGVTGKTLDLEMAQVSEIQLGPVTLRNVPVAFADLPPFKVFGLHEEPALLLGTDILETFRRVSLDFWTRKVRFQLRSCNSMAIALSTAPVSRLTRVSSTGSAEICGR